MTGSKIEQVLLNATGVKPQRRDEDRQKYLIRLMVGVVNISDEDWAALEAEPGVQEWYNSATDADNAKKPVPDFPDLEVGEAEEDDAESDEPEEDQEDAGEEHGEPEEDVVEEDQTPSKKAPKPAAKPAATPSKKAAAGNGAAKGKVPAGKASAKPAGKAAPAPAKAKPAPAPKPAAAPKAAAPKKGTSARRVLKLHLAKKPSASTEELAGVLEKKGLKLSDLSISSIRADTRDTIKALNEAGITNIVL